jgi:DNA helicase-2/ATP-dependent DNA helicase PcrA
MSSREFIAAWEELSPIQREAAEWDDGPLLVLAGPRAGNTRVVACRIARLLDSSRDRKYRIIGLAFNDRVIHEVKSSVANFVPREADRLFWGTFDSFCADVLRQHGTHIKIKPSFTAYSQDFDLQAVLNDVVEKAKKRSNLVSDLDKTTLPVIQRLKSRLILPEDCAEMFVDQRFAERMAVVYPAYEAELAARNALDFNSLILKTYQLFAKYPILGKRYRMVNPYICIYQCQKTTFAQYRLLRAITRNQYRNLFMVADDEQMIYQSDEGKRIMDFKNDYSPKVIQL